MFFVYPIHIFDSDGWLDNAKAKDKAVNDQVEKKKANMSKFRKYFDDNYMSFKGGLIPLDVAAKEIGVAQRTLRRYIEEMSEEFMISGNKITKI
jgi:hypothetical protein